MLDDNVLFEANDELAILNALSMTEVSSKKCKMYAGLATNADVRLYFEKRGDLMKRVDEELRKHLDRIGGKHK